MYIYIYFLSNVEKYLPQRAWNIFNIYKVRKTCVAFYRIIVFSFNALGFPYWDAIYIQKGAVVFF